MILLRFLLPLALFFSCQNKPAESRVDKIARETCNCATPLITLNKQAANAGKNIDFESIQAEFQKSRACILDLHLKPEDVNDVKNALSVKCPELATEKELMDELLGTQE